MVHWWTFSAVRKGLIFIGITAFFIVCIYGYVRSPLDVLAASSANENELPPRWKLKGPAAPKNAIFGMIYFNTKEKREYIFDGADWVPHDASVDAYYVEMDRIRANSLTVSQVLPPGNCGTGTGAHAKHATFDCQVCHYVGGVLCFDINGPAVAPGKPLPSFDVSAKTCSNISCHGVYSGTFSYYFPGGDGEPELRTVSYAGSGGSTPSWYATGLGCSACHGNPPRNGGWHSGYHAGTPTTASNQCQFCHPDASGSNGIGTTITNPTLHANGAVNVQARFTSSCFGCH
jgi:hypothetical protein